ncbi:polyphosphate polymerase domain-containing protein [Paraglaciecola sp.]|uniref:polyphosphate polymerase domain-containing protein n=1 Tax=Paraglaciecola sp. TaxID=1920173 RepID=UPI0030F49BDF
MTNSDNPIFSQVSSVHAMSPANAIKHFFANKQLEKFNDIQLKHVSAKEDLTSLLTGFSSHGLDDLNNANLMSRVDSKFILPMSFLPVLLAGIRSAYSVLKINDKQVFEYQNYYFDTPEMRFYNDHHNGKLNRFKVRHRNYLDTNTQFLEVKFKNNQNRTIKTRIKLRGQAEQDDIEQNELCSQFISQQMNRKFQELIISQQGGYSRIALASEQRAERLTLDFDLWFQGQASHSEKVALPGFFVAELKQNKHSKQSPAYQILTANGFHPTSFSKYCIGCALIYGNSLKSNQFKKTLLRIQQFNVVEPTSQPWSHLND